MSEGEKCPHCNGRGFFEKQCLWGAGFNYRTSSGWCKGTGKVQSLEDEAT